MEWGGGAFPLFELYGMGRRVYLGSRAYLPRPSASLPPLFPIQAAPRPLGIPSLFRLVPTMFQPREASPTPFIAIPKGPVGEGIGTMMAGRGGGRTGGILQRKTGPFICHFLPCDPRSASLAIDWGGGTRGKGTINHDRPTPATDLELFCPFPVASRTSPVGLVSVLCCDNPESLPRRGRPVPNLSPRAVVVHIGAPPSLLLSHSRTVGGRVCSFPRYSFTSKISATIFFPLESTKATYTQNLFFWGGI